jgi:hypothetical protein
MPSNITHHFSEKILTMVISGNGDILKLFFLRFVLLARELFITYTILLIPQIKTKETVVTIPTIITKCCILTIFEIQAINTPIALL